MLGILLALLATGPGFGKAPGVGGTLGNGFSSSTGNPIVFQANFAVSGARIPDDAGTVVHVTWNGSALVDSKGNAWTQNGTVPQVSTGPFFPSGFAAAAKPGAGVFSDANYYSLGTGADVLDFAGDFSVCALVVDSAGGALLANLDSAAFTGYQLRIDGAHTPEFIVCGSAACSNTIKTSNLAVAGPNVICAGRSGTSGLIKANLGTTVTVVKAMDSPSSVQARLGRATTAGASFQGQIYELWVSTTTPTDALFTSIQQGVFGHIAATGQALTVTRSTTATTSIAGTEYTWPAGVLRIDSGGAIIEPQRTNAFLNSDAPATQTITFGTGQETAWVVGSGSIALAVGTATATGLPCTATAASSCVFNVTVGGTVVSTYTAPLTFVQEENGPFATSKVHTAGTAVSRSSDAVTFTNPLTAADTAWCMSDTATDIAGNAWGSVTAGLLAMGNISVANTAQIFAGSASRGTMRVYDNAVGSRDITPAGGVPSTGTHRAVGCYQGVIQSFTLDTTTSTTVLSGAGTGVLSAMPATVTLGNLDGGTNIYLGGWHHKNVAISRTSDPARLP